MSDAEFLADVSRILGDHQALTRSTSYQAGRRSTTTTVRAERTFDVAALAALPPGRAVVMLSGARPVLVATESCHQGPHAAAIRGVDRPLRHPRMTAIYEDDDVELAPDYPDVIAFFAAELRPIIERRIGPPRGVAWCSTWWEHPEAVFRLSAVWAAWEATRDRSMWLFRHVDPHLAVLFDGETGPF